SAANSSRRRHARQRAELCAYLTRGAVGSISLRSRRSEQRLPWQRLKKRMGKRFSMTWVGPDGATANDYPQIEAGALLSMASAEQLFGLSPLSFEEALEANEKGLVASTNLGVEVTMARRSMHKSVTSPNVIGMIRGTDPALLNEYIVYSAHLDHVGVRDDHGDHGDAAASNKENGAGPKDSLYNGAYDNAMGVALMLETARALAAAPPKRSVLFIALTAEEKGLLGSEYFVAYPTVPAGSMVANINLDMPLFIFPPADLIAFGSERSSLQPVVEASAKSEGFLLSPDPMPEENLFVRSDQISFVRKGVPAVYLISGFQSANEDQDGEALFRDHLKHHYHEPSDDLSRPVDWDSARRFARANARIGFGIGQAADRPTWNEGDFFGERFGR
ncbi:MAG: M28 family peptidase, partial [Pseudomonadota bacterium]